MEKIPIKEVFDENPWFSESVSVTHSPDRFLLDFKLINPQFNMENKPTFIAIHKVVLIDIYLAKNLLKLLSEQIKKYEDKFGKIEKPEAIKKAERMMKSTTTATVPFDKPSYVG